MSKTDRSAGILLHPSSLPGDYGIGSLGQNLHYFLDSLAASGCRRWQILPLGPLAYGNSPYSSYSSFAGNPLLISISKLQKEGWLEDEILSYYKSGTSSIDYENLQQWKIPLLAHCYNFFLDKAELEAKAEFANYCQTNADWLNDYCLFMAIKEEQGGNAWQEWEPALRNRENSTLRQKEEQLNETISIHKFRQFVFDRQWNEVHEHCRKLNISIIGDLPIFVALDSADVWTQQKLFHLDKQGSPTVVAGVPPDYFSATGQLWGNPLYNWKQHKKEKYAWWCKRLATTFSRVDIVRIDHFRGFTACWEIPAGETTAENGKWVKGPGKNILKQIKKELGSLPLIAEDLGIITPRVEALRKRFSLPGMCVLQFAFADEPPKTASHAPHNHKPDRIVYTGTHDNDTIVSWFYGQDHTYDLRPDDLRERERKNCLAYLGTEESNDIHWKIIQLALSSVAATAIIPMQDLLGLGSEARLNRPGSVGSQNWSWRLSYEQLDQFASAAIGTRLKNMLWRFGRD